MSKNKTVKVGGHVDEIEMTFPETSIPASTSTPSIGETPKPAVEFKPAVDPPKPAVTPDQIEDYSVDGKKVYSKNTVTGEYTWYDADGKEITGYTLENLNMQYSAYPDKDDLNTEKDGPLQSREVDENNNSPGHPDFTKTWAISERQNYKSGQAITRTIPLKFLGIVKTLRGEAQPVGNKESGSTKDEEIKKEGNEGLLVVK